MKLMHLSDLHLGKRVNGFSMIEDQIYILNQIIEIAVQEQPDGVLIAGDVYDKSVPPAEAVELFDDFLVRLSEKKAHIFVISGNHDSAERLAFGSRLMEHSGVHFSPVYDGTAEPIRLTDEYGTVNIFMLPFLKPAHVKQAWPEEEAGSYTEAAAVAVKKMEVDPSQRNVLMTHQFVTGALRCESEELSAGGADNVDAAVYEPFDYVALGHLHGPQSAGRATIRYCGTPLKYSFSEIKHHKSVTVTELLEKGAVNVRAIPLTPKRDLSEIRGSYMEVTAKQFYENKSTGDYLRVILTDESDIPDAIGKLRAIYPRIMKLEYDNARTRENKKIPDACGPETRSPAELFEDFYELQNNQKLSQEQRGLVNTLIEKIWEGDG